MLTLTRSGLLRAATLAAAAAVLAACSSTASMQSAMARNKTNVSASLTSAAEVPTNSSTATGSLDGTYDKVTRELRWKLNYSGLTGPATAAHIHGPAMPGQNAGVVIPFPTPATGAEGSATLTEPQAADLLDGKWYVNVHTAANPGGEIRGQLMIR